LPPATTTPVRRAAERANIVTSLALIHRPAGLQVLVDPVGSTESDIRHERNGGAWRVARTVGSEKLIREAAGRDGNTPDS
jgi:hypothetical protein